MFLPKQASGLPKQVAWPNGTTAQGDLAMHLLFNGVRLFFDVEGAQFQPDGPAMREKPTLLLLHGGPGADHSTLRPAYSALADIIAATAEARIAAIRDFIARP
jgi:pimeloyl-ACP methyl ester carboxylesterase